MQVKITTLKYHKHHASTHWRAVCSCIVPFAAAAGTFWLSWSFKSLADHRKPISFPRRAVLFASASLTSWAELSLCLQTEWITFLLWTVLCAHRTPASLYVRIKFRHPITLLSQTRSLTRFQSSLCSAFRGGALEDRCEHLTKRGCTAVTGGTTAADPLLDGRGHFGAADFGRRCRCVWWQG